MNRKKDTSNVTGALVGRTTSLDDLPELLNIEEFRQVLGIGRTTAYQLIRTEQVKSRKFGRRIFIPKSELEIR